MAITNIIMDELLGEDRAPRSFRAKFPEEVLQESLAGQLWFGAECLAAGSSIMNRETESAQMRPLAKAVTKSLDHVRNLLREQCLRNKTPNSLTLNLDLNDAVTETLCESLKIFDRLFAEFELLYVSAMVQVKTKQEHEMQELICVLFSETLQRALRIGLLEQEQVDYYDPALMFSIPRLAIVAGLVIYNKGPLNMSMPADQLSEMFRPFRTLLIKIRDLLRTLNTNELYQLEKLLCTNEDIHIYTSKEPKASESGADAAPVTDIPIRSFSCDDSEDEEKFTGSNSSVSSTSSESTTSTVSRTSSNTSQSTSTDTNSTLGETDFDRHLILNRTNGTTGLDDNGLSTNHRLNVWTNAPYSSPTMAEASSTALLPDTSMDAESPTNKNEWISTECASGYLIPNTNFGNLLQTTDTPLTDSFISSDDEYTQKNLPTVAEDDDSMYVVGSTSMHSIDNEANMAAIQSMMDNMRASSTSDSSHMQAIDSMPDNAEINRIALSRATHGGDSGIGTATNTSLDHTPDSENNRIVDPSSTSHMTISRTAAVRQERIDRIERPFDVYDNGSTTSNASEHYNPNTLYHNYTTYHQAPPQQYADQFGDLPYDNLPYGESISARVHAKLHPSQRDHMQHSRRDRYERKSGSKSSGSHHSNSSRSGLASSRRRSSRHRSARNTEEKVSISSTSCIYSEGEPQDVWQSSGRMKFK